MKVLVTGADGFIGSRLSRSLVALGHDVSGMGLVKGPSVQHKGSILDKEWLAGIVKEISPDLVYHFAAISSVGFSFRDPSMTYDVNVTGTLNLLDPLDEGTRVVFSGSSEEYGEPVLSRKHYNEMKERYGYLTEPFRIPELPSREEDPLRPISPYAASKVMGEMLVLGYPGIDGLCARSYNIEGPGRGPDFVTSKITSSVRVIESGGVLEIGNIFNFRDWSHVDDAVRYYSALGEKGVPGEVYNIGSGMSRSIFSFVLSCFERKGIIIDSIKGKEIHIDDPMDISTTEIFGRVYDHYAIDDLLVEEDLRYLKGSRLELVSGDDRYYLELKEQFFRDRDIRFQAGDMSKLRGLGAVPENDLDDIVSDLIVL